MDVGAAPPSRLRHRTGRRRVPIAIVVGLAAVTLLAAVAALSGFGLLAEPGRGSGAPVAQDSGTPGPTTGATPTPSASGPAGGCGRQPGPAPAVKVTNVKVGTRVTGYGREDDTDPLPMAIAARPDGGSCLAWLGTDNRVYLGRLDCDDRLVGTPTSFAAINLQDVHADR